MGLSLSCTCGARFEVEDTVAGQSVACPECQQAIKVLPVRAARVRTSGYALASMGAGAGGDVYGCTQRNRNRRWHDRTG
jgi:DNA-directed RNA polymerase subunit RPC12/RpoP